MNAASTTDRDRRRPGRGAARNLWGRLRAPRQLAEEHERLVSTAEFRALRRTA